MSSTLLFVRLPSLQSKSLTLFFEEYMPAHVAAWSANAKSSHLEGDMLAKTTCGEFGALEQYVLTGKQIACAKEVDTSCVYD